MLGVTFPRLRIFVIGSQLKGCTAHPPSFHTARITDLPPSNSTQDFSKVHNHTALMASIVPRFRGTPSYLLGMFAPEPTRSLPEVEKDVRKLTRRSRFGESDVHGRVGHTLSNLLSGLTRGDLAISGAGLVAHLNDLNNHGQPMHPREPSS